MANGENCPGCADQAEPIHGGGNRLMAFKPMGKRGPTVYRDMTGIDEAHIEKLSGIQPFLATEGKLYDSTSGDGLEPLFRERPLGGNAIAFLGDVPDAAMSPQVEPSGMSKEEVVWENYKWKEREASDAASRADMAATSVEGPPRRSRGVQSKYGTPDGRNRRQLPAYPDDVFELACGHSHRFASQVKLTVKREARGMITVPLPADVTADDLLRAQGDDPRDYKT